MPETVLPHFARHGTFVPTAGGRLTVSLPNEMTSATVVEVYGSDVAIVELKGPLLNQVGHQYKPKDRVVVQRSRNSMGIECWEPVDERKLHEMERAEALAREVAGPAKAPEDAVVMADATTGGPAPMEDGAAATPPQVAHATLAQDTPVPAEMRLNAEHLSDKSSRIWFGDGDERQEWILPSDATEDQRQTVKEAAGTAFAVWVMGKMKAN